MADRNGPDRFGRRGSDPYDSSDPSNASHPSDPRREPQGAPDIQPRPFPVAPINVGDGGPLITLPAPCGKHEVYYPQALKILAERRLRFYVFQAVCGCGTAYLIATLPAGPRFWFGGDPQAISDVYDRIPWPEHRFGLFLCKLAPSLDGLVTYFAADPA